MTIIVLDRNTVSWYLVFNRMVELSPNFLN